MNIANYDDLLKAAHQQTDPQRMLFVFTQSELPEDHDPAQAERFHSGRGGALTPIMYVDKKLDELSNFSDLVKESRQMGQPWKIVFVAALAGRNGVMPSDKEAQEALDIMVKSVQQGLISKFLAYDQDGTLIKLV